MGRPVWQIKIITLFWPMRAFLARMVNLPVIGSLMGLTFRGDRASYIPVGVDLNPSDSTAMPTQMVEQFIQEASFRFVLEKCMCRSLEHCRRYPEEMGCLFLGEGAREIAPSLGQEISKEKALAHHRKAVSLGLIPMLGRLKWDSLWLGVRRADRLMTVCYCCDCCCYFGIYRYLPPRASNGLQKLEGLEIRVSEACEGCGACVERCFIGAMAVREGRAVPGENCRGCGRCAAVCPKKAVTVILPASAAVPCGGRGKGDLIAR